MGRKIVDFIVDCIRISLICIFTYGGLFGGSLNSTFVISILISSAIVVSVVNLIQRWLDNGKV